MRRSLSVVLAVIIGIVSGLRCYVDLAIAGPFFIAFVLLDSITLVSALLAVVSLGRNRFALTIAGAGTFIAGIGIFVMPMYADVIINGQLRASRGHLVTGAVLVLVGLITWILSLSKPRTVVAS